MFTYLYPPQSVSVAVPPSEFVLDGLNQAVTQDTLNSANNRAMPTLDFFYEGADQVPATYDPLNGTFKGIPSTIVFDTNGTIGPVKKDTSNPSNSVGLPVELVGNSTVKFLLDGIPQEVTEDTSVPASSQPLPVKSLDASGNIVSPLTDAQLRATPVPVSASSLPLPTGAATESTLSSIDTKTPSLVSGRVPVDGSGVTQPISAALLPLPTGAATAANQTTANSSLSTIATNTTISKGAGLVDANTTRVTVSSDGPLMTSIGAPADAAASSDTGSFSIISFIKRGLQNWTTLLARVPTGLTVSSSRLQVESLAVARVINSMSQSTTTTSATLTAPANARGFTIQNSTRASGALRFTQSGGGASATVGFLLEPGQSTSYQEGASSLSVFAVDGTAIDACVIWYV